MEKNEMNRTVIVKKSTRLQATSKEVRQIGFDLGYGITTGVFAAMFVINIGIGFGKALKKRAEKKIGVSVEVKPDEDAVEETKEE